MKGLKSQILLRNRLAGALLALSAFGVDAVLAGGPVSVTVTGSYVDLHTSPGRGYPVFEVAERGDKLMLLKQRTAWIKVRTASGKEGWVSEEQLHDSLKAGGVIS
jgi:uncharacterized protein YraI